MSRALASILIWLGLTALALGQISPPQWVGAAYNYKNITTDTTTTIASVPVVLGSICINSTASTETITVYDSATASGTKIATITLGTATAGCFSYNAATTVGLTVVTATAVGDITVIWHQVP